MNTGTYPLSPQVLKLQARRKASAQFFFEHNIVINDEEKCYLDNKIYLLQFLMRLVSIR